MLTTNSCERISGGWSLLVMWKQAKLVSIVVNTKGFMLMPLNLQKKA